VVRGGGGEVGGGGGREREGERAMCHCSKYHCNEGVGGNGRFADERALSIEVCVFVCVGERKRESER